MADFAWLSAALTLLRFFKNSLFRHAARVTPAMSLTLSNVTILANLAQLELNDEQAARSLAKLNEIFALVEQMQSVDTTGIAPLNHPIAAMQPDLCLRLRDDVVTESNHREDYQRPAPATQDGLYLVPKVLD
jgi:aspartyl-tRNA(Asn)/glutamyl-tRNA(Gln) amidotransferase subunit C